MPKIKLMYFQMIEIFKRISFENSLILWLLLSLPIIFFISKLRPQKKYFGKFAGFFILKQIETTSNIPKNSPLWLKVLRTIFGFCLIIGFSGPYLIEHSNQTDKKPILFIVENDVALGNEIDEINNSIKAIITNPNNIGREYKIIALFDPQKILENNKSINFQIDVANFKINRETIIPKIKAINNEYEIHYFTNDIESQSDNLFFEILKTKSNNNIFAHRPQKNFATIKTITNDNNTLKLGIFATKSDIFKINAFDKNGQNIAKFNANSNAANLTIGQDKISKIAYFEIEGQKNAGGVFIIDKNLIKPIVLSPKLINTEQPLISDAHFIWSSLKIFANPIDLEFDKIHKQNPNAIIFGDIAGFNNNETRILKNYMENGGTIIRFIGPKAIANPNDEILSANISSQIHKITTGFGVKPVVLLPFAKNSSFSNIQIPQNILVQNSIHFAQSAKPSEIIAQLSDGSPYLSMKNFGRGKLYMFHINAAPIWSNAALSTFHMELIKEIIIQSKFIVKNAYDLNIQTTLNQTIEINKNGNLNRELERINSINTPITSEIFANEKLPPGLYENDGNALALNIGASFKNAKIINLPDFIKISNAENDKNKFSDIFLIIAFILLFLDVILTSTNLKNIFKFAILIYAFNLFSPNLSYAQITTLKDDLKLAYIITNDQANDKQSQSGLLGLANALEQRTNIEPNGTIGINLEKDELAKHPIIYWLIPKNGMEISQKSRDALNKYMQNGGILFIDTQALGMENSRAQNNLKKAVYGLKIPPLEKVPPDHVLKKSFYLLQNFQGFYKNSSLWVESAASKDVSANDGVTPIIISDGNFARLWAGSKGQSITTIFGGNFDDELGIRAGINIIIYALTGQYKGDQIHINSILKKFNRGQE